MKLVNILVVVLLLGSFLTLADSQDSSISYTKCNIENCINCESENVCKQCKEGYFGNDCLIIDCSKVKNCLTGCF